MTALYGLFEKLTLSPRELEICILASQGLSNKQVAIQLKLTPGTVITHRKRAYRKYRLQGRGVDNGAMLLRRLIEDGHVPEIRKLA